MWFADSFYTNMQGRERVRSRKFERFLRVVVDCDSEDWAPSVDADAIATRIRELAKRAISTGEFAKTEPATLAAITCRVTKHWQNLHGN